MMRRFLSVGLLLLTGVLPLGAEASIIADRPGLAPAGATAIDAASGVLRVGGLVRTVDPVHKAFVIFSSTKARRFTIDVAPSTLMTLGRWPAGFTDVQVGDHLTVSGDAASPSATDVIVARTIRVGSPHFGGRVVAIAPGAGGAVVLSVLASHRHVLTITVAPTTTVLYGSDKGVIGNLTIGERVVAHGVRQNKYLLAATSVRIYLHQHTIGGTITAATAGPSLVYTLLSPNGGGQHTVRTTARTVYSMGGHTVAATLVRVGTHIRARGYDLPRGQNGPGNNIPTLIATHVTILIQHHRTHTKRHTPPPIHHAPPVKHIIGQAGIAVNSSWRPGSAVVAPSRAAGKTIG